MSCTVEGNPVPWQRAGFASRGGGPQRFFTAHATRKYEKLVALHARCAGFTPYGCEVRMTVRFFRQTAQRCDLDNLVKSVKDALIGIAYQDDSQVVHLEASKHVDRDRPRVEITIAEFYELGFVGMMP